MRDINLSPYDLIPILITLEVARRVTDLNTERPGSRIEETGVQIKEVKRITIDGENYPGLRVTIGIESALQLRRIALTAPILSPIDVPIYRFVADLTWGSHTDKTPDYVEGEATRDHSGRFVVTQMAGYVCRPETPDRARVAIEIYSYAWPF